MSMTAADLTGQLNLLINKAIAGGVAADDIGAALTAQETALAASSPTHDRTIVDPGPDLNPGQPNPPDGG